MVHISRYKILFIYSGGLGPRTLHTLGNYSTTELHSHPLSTSFFWLSTCFLYRLERFWMEFCHVRSRQITCSLCKLRFLRSRANPLLGSFFSNSSLAYAGFQLHNRRNSTRISPIFSFLLLKKPFKSHVMIDQQLFSNCTAKIHSIKLLDVLGSMIHVIHSFLTEQVEMVLR